MDIEIDIGKRLMYINNKIRRYFDASFAESGITGTQATILHFLYNTNKYRDVFQRDIEAEFSIRRSSVTSVLDNLEKSGYIRRESVMEDARLKKLVLTEKAVQMSKTVSQLMDEINTMLAKDIPNQDMVSLDFLLKSIEKNLP